MISDTPLHRYTSKIGIDCLREGANGRSSIQVTVDTYGHLIPGADVSFVDRPDEVPVEKAKRSPQQSATPANQKEALPPETRQTEKETRQQQATTPQPCRFAA